MSLSKSFDLGADTLSLGQGDQDVNIVSKNGTNIKINGIVPSDSGGGGGVPAVGDIDFIGNLNCNDVAGGGAKGIITAEKKVVSGLDGIETTGDVNIKANGNLTLEGNGNISNASGTGKITSGSAGIESKGDITTIGAHDLVIGRDIYFDGQDIYHRTFNPSAQQNYKDFKQLPGKNDPNIYTGSNKFRDNAVSIQALNDDVPAVYEDKITLNTDGNINCNEINNNTLLKSNSIICQNGAPESQKVMARQYHFRPNSLETTGWVFSQKPPDNPAIPEDNYLMLQNTQATGSLNLVKSSFDPQNPTQFDIILDPQNGQVKTTTSFDAPQVNFRKNAVDNWSIFQPPAGDANENKLRIQNYQDNAGAVQILDDSNNIWADFNNLATSFNKPTFINNTLNVIGNAVINSAYSLLFGAYSFKPIQYIYSTAITIRDTPDTTNYTNMIFNCLGVANQPTLGGKNVWTRVNDGQTGISLYNNALEGFYKCSIKQLGNSSSTNFIGTEIIFDYILAASIQDTPDLTPSISYGYNKFPADRSSAITTVASILIDHNNTLSSQSQPVFLNFSHPPVVGETMSILITLTKLDF